MQLEAEGRRDIRAALQAIRERVGIVELQAKLMGEIQTGNRSVTLRFLGLVPIDSFQDCFATAWPPPIARIIWLKKEDGTWDA